MNLQTILNEAVVHLVNQGRRSTKGNEIHMAFYRGDEGRKCPVGFFIADEKYYPELEGKNVNSHSVIESIRDDVKSVPEALELLVMLQNLHDRYDIDGDEFNKIVASIACTFNLNAPQSKLHEDAVWE